MEPTKEVFSAATMLRECERTLNAMTPGVSREVGHVQFGCFMGTILGLTRALETNVPPDAFAGSRKRAIELLGSFRGVLRTAHDAWSSPVYAVGGAEHGLREEINRMANDPLDGPRRMGAAGSFEKRGALYSRYRGAMRRNLRDAQELDIRKLRSAEQALVGRVRKGMGASIAALDEHCGKMWEQTLVGEIEPSARAMAALDLVFREWTVPWLADAESIA